MNFLKEYIFKEIIYDRLPMFIVCLLINQCKLIISFKKTFVHLNLKM